MILAIPVPPRPKKDIKQEDESSRTVNTSEMSSTFSVVELDAGHLVKLGCKAGCMMNPFAIVADQSTGNKTVVMSANGGEHVVLFDEDALPLIRSTTWSVLPNGYMYSNTLDKKITMHSAIFAASYWAGFSALAMSRA